jgi:glycosyltransferase involved in cell wall biosynthesis
LARAIECSLQQDHEDLEIIVVDNNSTDATYAIAAKFAKRYPARIQLIQERQQGCSAARNAGLRLSKGEWIQFLDADDTISPTKISHQLGLLQEDTQWVIAAYRHLYADESTETSFPHQNPWQGLVHNFAIGNTCANLYHRNALKRINGWNTTLTDNTDHRLHFELLKVATPWVLDPKISMTYHHHLEDRVSTRDPGGRLLRKAQFHRDVNAYLKQRQSAQWKAHRPYFSAALLRSLRLLATHDLAAADQLYRQEFHRGPGALDHRVVSKFVKLYPILGFSATERIRLALSNLLPPGIKLMVKRLLSNT